MKVVGNGIMKIKPSTDKLNLTLADKSISCLYEKLSDAK
jgi:hypothetical protein